MGRTSAASATTALRLLSNPDLRQQPATGPTTRRATPSTPGTPLNVGLVDYLDEHRGEVVGHVRSLTPGQDVHLPAQDEDFYAWYIAQTGHAGANDQAFRDMVIERHALEHAIALGETEAVCKHPCPSCGCWGLMWDEDTGKAKCTQPRCRTPEGLSPRWTLARLAAQKIQRTEIWRRSAT